MLYRVRSHTDIISSYHLPDFLSWWAGNNIKQVPSKNVIWSCWSGIIINKMCHCINLITWQAFRASLTMSFTSLTIEIGQWHSSQEILAQLPSWGFQPIDNEVPKMNKSSIPWGYEPLTCCFTRRTFPLLIFFVATDSLCGKKYGKRCNQFMNQPHNSFSMPFTT